MLAAARAVQVAQAPGNPLVVPQPGIPPVPLLEQAARLLRRVALACLHPWVPRLLVAARRPPPPPEAQPSSVQSLRWSQSL